MCGVGEFGFVNSMIKKMWKSRTKITYKSEQNRSRKKVISKSWGGGITLMRHCVRHLNKRQLTIYQ